MALFDQVRDAVETVRRETRSPEQIVSDLLADRQRTSDQILNLARSGNFGDVVVGTDMFGEPVLGASGDKQRLAALDEAYRVMGDQLKMYAGGGAGGDGGLSASVAAQIAQQDRQLAESMRQFDVSEARAGREFAESMAFNREELGVNREQFAQQMDFSRDSLASQERRDAAQLAESQRANNLSSTLDLLTNQIRTGEIGVAEASNRISAATNAANIQRDVLADWGGRALPAGTTHYPNLGPTGPIAAVANQLGVPFSGFETMGTFGVNPGAIASPITDAASTSVLPSVNDAVARTAAALAGMGVPMMAEGGMVDGPFISGENGPEINFPLGNGRTFVMNDQMLQQRFPGANSMFDIMAHGYHNPDAPTGIVYGGGHEGGMPMSTPTTQPIEPPAPNPGGPQLGMSFRPEMLMRIAQMLAGYGVPPFTPQGNSMRRPQVGASGLSSALAGG